MRPPRRRWLWIICTPMKGIIPLDPDFLRWNCLTTEATWIAVALPFFMEARPFIKDITILVAALMLAGCAAKTLHRPLPLLCDNGRDWNDLYPADRFTFGLRDRRWGGVREAFRARSIRRRSMRR